MLEEFIEKLRLIDEILQDLIQDNTRWVHFNDELKRLETLFREIGSMFDAKMFGERPLEEKQQILEVKTIDYSQSKIFLLLFFCSSVFVLNSVNIYIHYQYYILNVQILNHFVLDRKICKMY
jgi:hypothetical protein